VERLAYSPRLGAHFVPATDWCAEIRAAERAPDPDPNKNEGLCLSGESQFDPWSKAQGWLTAFDAATGAQLWRYHSSNIRRIHVKRIARGAADEVAYFRCLCQRACGVGSRRAVSANPWRDRVSQ
jgi:hypothetical protein